MRIIRHLLFALALLSVLTGTSVDGQSRFRFVGSAAAGDRSVLTQSDITYLGAYPIPRSTPTNAWDTLVLGGLALRRETSDVGNEVHLLSTAIQDGDPFGSGYTYPVYEWRDRAPQNPADPLDVTQYTAATIVKEYPNAYRGADTNFKRLVNFDGGADSNYQVSAGPDWYGLFWDSTDNRLYWTYAGTYNNSATSWHFGYSTLNYSAGTASAVGPYKLTSWGWKSAGGGMTEIPLWYASRYTSGQRLAIGFGGYGSLGGSGGVSMGPALTAIDRVTASEGSTLANTPLVGYQDFVGGPTGGAGRMTRSSSLYDISSLGETWGLDKWSWSDTVTAGAWVDTGTKHGFICFPLIGEGMSGYLGSNRIASWYSHYAVIYDPMDFTPASGTARYDVQPTSMFRMEYPQVDYAGTSYPNNALYWAGQTHYTITSITATAGVSVGQTNSTGPHVITGSAHGKSAGDAVNLYNTSQSEYNSWWKVGTVVNATEYTIYRDAPADAGHTWTGTSASGGISIDAPTAPVQYVGGAVFDSVTNILYVLVERTSDYAPHSSLFVLKYQVN